MFTALVVHHFMQQCGGYFFDGPCKCASSDVDLMGCTILGDPSVILERKVTEGLGRRLVGYGGS